MNLLSFSFSGNPIRVVMQDEQPWWVAKDVAEVLDYTWNGSARIEHVPSEWRGVTSVVTRFGTQDMAVLSEQGLYFFLGRSDKPKALPFQMWLAGDVVPSIRKNGMYATDALLDNPEHLLEVTRRLVEERRGRLAAEAKVLELAPKADFHDQVTAAVNCLEIGEFAKLMLGTGPNRFFKWLREQKILKADNLPFQQHLDAGHLRVEERTRADKHEQKHAYLITLVTGKGQPYLQKRWAQAGNVVQMQLQANG